MVQSLHKKYILVVYHDTTSSFEELLKKENSVSIHYRNMQALAIKMSGCTRGYTLGPKICELVPTHLKKAESVVW